MDLESSDDIEKFRDILNFLGYKTTHSVGSLQQTEELNRFVIEAAKLHRNVQFREKFKDLDVDFGSGDILVLKEIAAAAIGCVRGATAQDEETIKIQTLERCKKV